MTAEKAREATRLGYAERDQGQLGAALAHYQEAEAIYRQLDDPLALAHTVRHVGDIHRQMGHPELAEPCYDEALALYRANQQAAQPLDVANAIRAMAVLKDQRELWKEARDIYAEVGVQAGVDECNRRLATPPPQPPASR